MVDYVNCILRCRNCFNLSGRFYYVSQDAVNTKSFLRTAQSTKRTRLLQRVNSTAGERVFVTAETDASNTGWATMRWLLSTKELLAPPDTGPLVEYSTQKVFHERSWRGIGIVLSRKYVQDSSLISAISAEVTDLAGLQQRGTELSQSLTVNQKL